MAAHSNPRTVEVLARLQACFAVSGKRSLDEEKDWATLFGLLHPCLRNLGAHLRLRPDQIEDTIQTVFAELVGHWQKLTSYPGPELPALICTIMRHRALDARRQGAQHHVESLNGLADHLLDRSASEDALLAEAAEWHEWLEARLKELEVEHEECAALLRAFLKGGSYEELAEAKRCSVHAIKCRLTRAFQALQRLAKKHPPGGEPPP